MPKSDLRLAYTTSHIDFDKMKRFVINKIFFRWCSFNFSCLVSQSGRAALPLVAIEQLDKANK